MRNTTRVFVIVLALVIFLPKTSFAYIENAPRESTETKKVNTTKIEEKVKNFKTPNFIPKLLAPIERKRLHYADHYRSLANTDQEAQISPDEKTLAEKTIDKEKILNKDSSVYKKYFYKALYFIFAEKIVFYVLFFGLIALALRLVFRFFI